MRKSGNGNVQLLKVQIRGGFADRNNVHPVNTTMQYENFDDRSRTALVNMINLLYYATFENLYGYEKKTIFWRTILSEVYSQQIEWSSDVSYREDKMFDIINSTSMKMIIQMCYQ